MKTKKRLTLKSLLNLKISHFIHSREFIQILKFVLRPHLPPISTIKSAVRQIPLKTCLIIFNNLSHLKLLNHQMGTFCLHEAESCRCVNIAAAGGETGIKLVYSIRVRSFGRPKSFFRAELGWVTRHTFIHTQRAIERDVR